MTARPASVRPATVRPATTADVAALTALWRTVDTHWFGRPEHDEDETREALELLDDLERDTRLTVDGAGRPVCAVLRGRHDAFVLVPPDEPGAVAGALDWLARRVPARVEVLDRDATLIAALRRRGWRYSHSSFELARDVSDGWPSVTASWPDGVTLREAVPADLEGLHRLIYDDARFADVPGHILRDQDEWRKVFVDGRPLSDGVVLACRDGRMVGVSLIRRFSDGTGWISLLAVSRGEQGRGLGRALVLESFHRLVAGGATALGLGVMAANRGALRLYLDLGLAIDREWQLWDLAADD